MKTAKAYNILFLVSSLALAANTFAADPEVEKKKTFSKSYNVSGNDKVSFDNRFGELKINTWDKSEVKVDVTITAKANSEERAQEILDRIKIEDNDNNSGVSIKTIIQNDNRKWENNDKEKNKEDKEKYKNEGFTINYVVYVPSRNPLYAHNEFGPMSIDDHNGEVVLESKFGSLTAGRLDDVKRVNVEFGSASVESINGGELVVKFSRAIIGKLNGSVNANFEHCSGIKLGLDNSTKDLNIKNNFTTLYLDASKNLSANLDITTNHGQFSNKSSFDMKKQNEDDSHGPRFTQQYSVKAGNGNSDMKIRSQFGQIILGHNLDMELKKEKKDTKPTRTI
jgi:hypothetical protein